MMQKYADRLESLVDERTAQLQQEKRTTEALLLRMLPKYVTLSLTAQVSTYTAPLYASSRDLGIRGPTNQRAVWGHVIHGRVRQDKTQGKVIRL